MLMDKQLVRFSISIREKITKEMITFYLIPNKFNYNRSEMMRN